MSEQLLQTITLSKIAKNPQNPRRNFSGPAFDELVDSIRQKGVIQPIMVRPLKNGKTTHQIIFGERRFRASCAIAKANGGLAKHTIPALVRDLSDDEAFELMTIENLQRHDITELEEAESFKAYIDRMGDDAVAILAERIGIKPNYIKRRVVVLRLPKYVLKSWEEGNLKYGHLEQLVRIGDKKIVRYFFDEIMESLEYKDPLTVRDLKQRIDNKSPGLKEALFDTKKEGCNNCFQNSEVQKSLFESEAEAETRCSNPQCFVEKQRKWLTENWQEFKKKNKICPNFFAFDHEYSWDDYNVIWNWERTPDDCKPCPHFTVLLYPNGAVFRDKVCTGDSKCFEKNEEKAKAKGEVSETPETEGEAPKKKEGPRVAWHGTHFREIFFREQLPERIKEVPNDDVKAVHVALFALIQANRDLHYWFAEKIKMNQSDKVDRYTYLHGEEIFQIISKMDKETALNTLREAAVESVLSDGYAMTSRRLVGEHIGIDVSKEWAITEEYLNKKVIGEILEFGEELEIFNDEKAKAYAENELKKSIDDVGKFKKAELKKLILESGVDLVGKVPKEILIMKEVAH